MSGFGAGGWGGVPWGGADQLLGQDTCDLLLFDATNMVSILSSPAVEGTGDPTQFVYDYPTPPGGSNDLGILSGDPSDPLFSTDTIYLTAATTVDDEYTLELTLTFESLPNNFNSLAERHFMFGVTDATGPCVAIFVSKVGLAYAGAVHHVPGAPATGTLVLDSSLQSIPGTASYAQLGVQMTYRIAVSATAGAVYLFATPTADLGITGHQLVAVLPVIDAGDLTFPPSGDRALISARGTSIQSTRAALDLWCLSSTFDIPNVVPVANAGQDQAVRACSIARLDGSASFDPEGAPLSYSWRLIDTPPGSEFAVEASDGATYPLTPFVGLTSRFHSAELGAIEAVDPIQLGSVLLYDGVAYDIVGKATDANGFFVQVPDLFIPYPLAGRPFKILRQRGLSAPTEVQTSFFPDVPGFYKFDLTVYDGSLYSQPSVVIVNVLESVLPRGCTPNTEFLFNYLGDFWKLVEEAESLGVVWSGLAQVAATELYTLWQHEYSKSLRDIQRTVIRRWLHYDLLLAEALPELTTLRALYSGVQSSNVALVGDPGVIGTSLVILSDSITNGEAVIDWVGSTTAVGAAQELRNRLLEVDSRFTVTEIPDRTGTYQVIRIDAPFPYTVDESSTTPIFSAGTNGTLMGAGAAGGGSKTYVVDRSLAGLGIQEDDLLVLDGIGYRINRVVSGTSFDPDAFDSQRLTLKDELPIPAPTTWSITSVAKSQLLDFYNGLVSEGDSLYFEVTDVDPEVVPEFLQTTVTGVAERLPGRVGFDISSIGAAIADPDKTVLFAKCVRRTYYPIDESVKDLPALQEHIVIEDDEATLRRNVDFFLEQYRGRRALRFSSSVGADVWEGEDPPDRLWAEYTYIDNSATIEANFGLAAGFTLDDLASLSGDVDYLSAVRGLWYAFFNGPTPDNVRVGAQIFLALPFAEQAGTIEEIRADFSPTNGRILIRDLDNPEIVRSYAYPADLDLETNSETGEDYAVGDSVSQFAPLVKGVEVNDYISSPTWYSGIVQQGAFSEVQKYHTFSVRVDSAVFDLDSLLLVQDFAVTLRATYTYPAVTVALTVDGGATDIDVTDIVRMRGMLRLYDDPCEVTGSGAYDDPNPSGLGYWNQFDSDGVLPAPTYPVPDADVPWGFDSGYLCPRDSLLVNLTYNQAAPGIVQFDTFLAYDTALVQAVSFLEAGPVVIPANPGELTVSVVGSALAIFNGDLSKVRLLVSGTGPGAFATDYELVVEVNGVDTAVVPFDASDSVFLVEASVSGAVLLGQTVGLKVRVPAGSPSPGARSPGWNQLSGLVTVEDGTWSFGDVVPAGTYFISIEL